MRRAIWILMAAAPVHCSVQKRIQEIRQTEERPTIALQETEKRDRETETLSPEYRDTVSLFNAAGERTLFLKATPDSSGALLVTEALGEAVITATSKNIAERNGEVNLGFEIHVPAILIDSEWQIRLYPKAILGSERVGLDPLFITGSGYRKEILKGHELYDRFVRRILSDSSALVHRHLLDTFLERNIPADSSRGLYGISLTEAMERFERKIARLLNERRKQRQPEMYRRHVKDDLRQTNVRKDTLIGLSGTDLRYTCLETLKMRPGLRKIQIVLGGEITKNGERLLTIPDTDPLTYHVSSLKTLIERRTRFLTEIIERKVQENTSAWIDFAVGSAGIDRKLNRNGEELDRIEKRLVGLMHNEEYNIDSLVIIASSSPDGNFCVNERLSRERGEAIREYLRKFIEAYRKTDDPDYPPPPELEIFTDFEFIDRHVAENWEDLEGHIRTDEGIEDREGLLSFFRIRNPDHRDRKMSAHPEYGYLKRKIYPRLRCVKFNFHLHRKGMVKDTVHTTVVDSLYEKGLQRLEEGDYKDAIYYLGRYGDYNTALAYLALDYNASARSVLEKLPSSPGRDYLLAIVHSRNRNGEEALQYFLSAKEKDPKMYFRGNLDPEISRIIKKYGITYD